MKYTIYSQTDDAGQCQATFEVTLGQLLADAEVPCTSGCEKGWIDNSAAVRAWKAEHGDALIAYEAERRRRRSGTLGTEESALRATRPESHMRCECGGKGALLTDDGRALMAFLDRHRPMDHYHADGWA
jgi:hypothetical protein